MHRLQLTINQYFATPALVIVLATGFYQVAEFDYQLAKFWLSASITIVIVIGGLLGAYFIPSDRRLGPMVEGEIAAKGGGDIELSDLSEEYQKGAKLQGIVGTITGVLLVIAVYLMVMKPGL